MNLCLPFFDDCFHVTIKYQSWCCYHLKFLTCLESLLGTNYIAVALPEVKDVASNYRSCLLPIWILLCSLKKWNIPHLQKWDYIAWICSPLNVKNGCGKKDTNICELGACVEVDRHQREQVSGGRRTLAKHRFRR